MNEENNIDGSMQVAKQWSRSVRLYRVVFTGPVKRNHVYDKNLTWVHLLFKPGNSENVNKLKTTSWQCHRRWE